VNDPIVNEVRQVRDAHAARFNYDLDAIFKDLKEQEKRSGRNFVSFEPAVNEPAASNTGLKQNQKTQEKRKKKARRMRAKRNTPD
jgi:hypothetical protein